MTATITRLPGAKAAWIFLPADVLRPILPVLSKITAGKESLPCLKHVHIAYTNGTSRLTVCDLDQWVEFDFPDPRPQSDGDRVRIATEWVWRKMENTIHLGILKTCVQQADRGTAIRINWASDRCGEIHFVCKGVAMRKGFDGLNPTEFPMPPNPDIDGLIAEGIAPPMPWGWNHGEFDRLNRISPYLSADTTRYILNGAYLDPEGIWIGTDGRCLATVPSVSPPSDPFILPAKSVLFAPCFQKLAEVQAIATASVFPGKCTTLRLDWGSIRYTTNVIEGVFPNWRQILPPGNNATYTIQFGDDPTDKIIALRAILPNTADPSLLIHHDGSGVVSFSSVGNPPVFLPVAISLHASEEPFTAVFNGHWFTSAIANGYTDMTIQSEILPAYSAMPDGSRFVIMPKRLT